MTPQLLAELDRLIDVALAEDLGAGDLTTLACVPADLQAEAVILAKKPCTVAGLESVERLFARLSPAVKVALLVKDGQRVYRGRRLVTLSGPAQALLAGERVCLNILAQLCGVASQTHKFVERAANPAVAVLDTRKTTPGMRLLEKYAVHCGGGVNHRLGLYDQILIKENHIAAAGGILQAIEGARKAYGDKHPVQVEVRNQEELILAVEGGADSVLLDNMTPAQVKKLCKLVGRRIPTEASGGITLSNIKDYAATGVNRISVGALTHSAPAADLSMLFLGRQA